MKTLRLLLLLVLMSTVTHIPASLAQEESSPRKLSFGAGLSVKTPYDSFGEEFRTGYGINALLDYSLIPLLDLTATVGWNRFDSDAAVESIDIWEFVGGARFRLGVFFMSGEVGYYTEIDESSFLPGLGLRFTHFEFAFNVRAVSAGSWRGFRLAYYF